jgi:hypothetical protein
MGPFTAMPSVRQQNEHPNAACGYHHEGGPKMKAPFPLFAISSPTGY